MGETELKFLKEIEQAARRMGVSVTYLCFLAVGNGHLPRRLKAGKSVNLSTVEKLRAYIAERESKS